jgi:hypothetical protein
LQINHVHYDDGTASFQSSRMLLKIKKRRKKKDEFLRK